MEGTRTLQKKTVRERIIEKGNKWSFEPKLYLSKFGKPSTTVDIWSSRARRGYIAVSIHLNTNTGLETKVLDLAHIPSPHTGANIKRKFDQILNHHGLDNSVTYKVVSDNASNMKKAFQVSLWEDDAECTDADEPSDDEIVDEDSMDEDLVQNVVDVDFQGTLQAALHHSHSATVRKRLCESPSCSIPKRTLKSKGGVSQNASLNEAFRSNVQTASITWRDAMEWAVSVVNGSPGKF